jgi:hypothetical protein
VGQILPFFARVSARADWSGEERARLAELAERYSAAGVRVEVIYGATEEGDPWCVVKDEAEDVLIHVARIGDTFVVHYALDDALRQGQDLRSVLNERLGRDGRPEVVVPFSRQAQNLLALILAAGFFYETARPGDGAPPTLGPEPLDDPAGQAAGAADAHAPPAETALVGQALHAQAPGFLGLGGTGFEPARAAEWRAFADDASPVRMDHGGAELVSFAPGGPTGPIANLDVAAPRAPDGPSPVVLAFDDHPRPVALTSEAPATSTFGISQVAGFRKTDGDPPAPQPPQTPPAPSLVATHWVEVDTDGDGRPDTRVEVPDEPKHDTAEPPAAADQTAILTVGHGFLHAEIV